MVTSMNQLKHELFSSKKNTPRIKSLLTTDTASAEHLKRDHLQTVEWKSSDLLTKHNVNIIMFGWRIESGYHILVQDLTICTSRAHGNACSRNTF